MSARRRVLAFLALLLPLAATAAAVSWGMYYSLKHDAQPGADDDLVLALLLGPLACAVGGFALGSLRDRRGARLAIVVLLASALGVLVGLIAIWVTGAHTACVDIYDPGNQECGFGTFILFILGVLEMAALIVAALMVRGAVWLYERYRRRPAVQR